jgi:hypothetical protein
LRVAFLWIGLNGFEQEAWFLFIRIFEKIHTQFAIKEAKEQAHPKHAEAHILQPDLTKRQH